MDCNLPGSSAHGISQERILEWIAIPFSRGSSKPSDGNQASHIAGGFFTIWATREAQEYWVGSLSFLQGIILTQETNGGLCIAGAFFTRWASREVHHPSYPVLIGLVSFQAGKCELTLKYEQTIKSH